MDEKLMICNYLIDDLLAKGVIGKREASIAKSKVLEEIQRCNEGYTAQAA